MNRVTWNVTSWRNRYRATVYVDLHEVAHKFFDREDAAAQWCMAMAQMAEAECRVR
jgi:hypothetical protein